jgi:RNA polymerase sigma-70 factor (ECF subfamily)
VSADPVASSADPVAPAVPSPRAPLDLQRWSAAWQHRPYLLDVARRRVGWHDAEDVVHEAVVRAVHAAALPELQLRSWLLTTTKRLCADRARDEASQRRRRTLIGARPETTVAPGPEDDVCDDAEAVWVAKRVQALPVRQRQAVELRAQGLSVAQVGDAMGVPPKAVESLLGRARRIVKRAAAVIVGVVLATRLVVKRKAQLHVAVAALAVAGSAGVSAANASAAAAGSVASYGARQVQQGFHTATSTLWSHLDHDRAIAVSSRRAVAH